MSDKPDAGDGDGRRMWKRFGDSPWPVQLLAAVGLLGLIGLIGLVTVFLAIALDRPRYEPAKVEAREEKESFTVDNGHALQGTGLIAMEISLGAEGGSYSGRGRDLRNILLINAATGESRKILADNHQHIDGHDFLPAAADAVGNGGTDDEPMVANGEAGQELHRPPAYYWLETYGEDGERGARDLLVGSLATGKQAIVMQGINGVDRAWMRSPTQIAMILRDHLGLYYRVVDVPSLKVVASRKIEID